MTPDVDVIEFTVYGTPTALKRHRTVRVKDFVRQYDPSHNDKQDFLSVVLEHRPKIPPRCPIVLDLLFVMPRPKAHFRTGKFSHELKKTAPLEHAKIPDIDNLAKFVQDTLNSVFWHDDSQIYKLNCTKIYGDTPKVCVKIEYQFPVVEDEEDGKKSKK